MLQRLYIEATATTPRICFDSIDGKFLIAGRSLPENTEQAYRPVIDWLTEYAKQPCEKTTIEINLDYYNSTSLKKMADILMIIKEISQTHSTEASVIWLYDEEDDSSKENGEDLCYALDLPIELKIKEYE